MRDGIRKDLLVTEEIVESSDLRATPFEFESESLSCHTAGSFRGPGNLRARLGALLMAERRHAGRLLSYYAVPFLS